MALICALTVHSEYLDRYFHVGLRTVYKSIKLWKYPKLIRHKKVYSMRSSKRVQEHYPWVVWLYQNLSQSRYSTKLEHGWKEARRMMIPVSNNKD